MNACRGRGRGRAECFSKVSPLYQDKILKSANSMQTLGNDYRACDCNPQTWIKLLYRTE